MNDLDFQRKAYAEPECQDDDFVAYTNQLPDKQPLIDELKHLDLHLKRALNIIPPSGLIERIELNKNLLHHQAKHKQYAMVVIALSVLFFISALTIFLNV